MTQRHVWAVYGLIRWLQPKVLVEIGTYKGFVGLHMARACEDNGFGHVTVIDDFSLDARPAEVHNAFQRAGLSHRLTILDGKSTEVQWPKVIDFAMVDGDHEFESVLFDCNTAVEKGATCIVMHDTSELPGPREYIEVMREKGKGVWDVVEVGFDMGLSVLMRVPEKPSMFTMRPKE